MRAMVLYSDFIGFISSFLEFLHYRSVDACLESPSQIALESGFRKRWQLNSEDTLKP